MVKLDIGGLKKAYEGRYIVTAPPVSSSKIARLRAAGALKNVQLVMSKHNSATLVLWLRH